MEKIFFPLPQIRLQGKTVWQWNKKQRIFYDKNLSPFLDHLQEFLGIPPLNFQILTPNSSLNSQDLTLQLAPEDEHFLPLHSKDAYLIKRDENGLQVKALQPIGLIYGLQTLQALLKMGDGKIKEKFILDYPNVKERRLHVDMGRKFFTKDWLKKCILELEKLRFNTLQLHFAENLGFRLESKVDPSLMSEDGYLTQKEMQEILAFAKRHHVKIMPSFDTPGHVAHLLKRHPEFGQQGISGNYHPEALDITNPQAIAYIHSLYEEFLELFQTCEVFHIGGDEYMPFDREPFLSEYRPVLEAYAQKNWGVEATYQDTVVDYLNQLADLVVKHGLRPRIWNDGVFYGEEGKAQKLPLHAKLEVDYWSKMGWDKAVAGPEVFLEKGVSQLYNCNSDFFYYVLRNDLPEDGRKQHSFDHLEPGKRIYEKWQPHYFSDTVLPQNLPQVKGAGIFVWCDKPDLVSEEEVAADIKESLLAFGAKSWNLNAPEFQPYEEFKKITGDYPWFENLKEEN